MKSYIFPLAFLAASTSANVYEEIMLSGPFDEEVVPAGNSQPGMKVSWYPAKITGENHNLQQHSVVLVRGAKIRDLIGVNYALIRAKYDLFGVANRKTARSVFGVKKT